MIKSSDTNKIIELEKEKEVLLQKIHILNEANMKLENDLAEALKTKNNSVALNEFITYAKQYGFKIEESNSNESKTLVLGNTELWVYKNGSSELYHFEEDYSNMKKFIKKVFNKKN